MTCRSMKPKYKGQNCLHYEHIPHVQECKDIWLNGYHGPSFQSFSKNGVHRTLEGIKLYLAKRSKLEHEAARSVRLVFACYGSTVCANMLFLALEQIFGRMKSFKSLKDLHPCMNISYPHKMLLLHRNKKEPPWFTPLLGIQYRVSIVLA